MSDVNPLRAQGVVNYKTQRAAGEGVFVDLKMSKRGEACVIDFYTEMVLEGRGFQARAGLLTTPVSGDVEITTVNAEMAVDALNGLAILIVYYNLAIALGTATLYEYGLMTAETASSGGDLFTPLLLLGDTNGATSNAQCRVDEAGSTIVTADAITTTRMLWHGASPVSRAAAGAEESQHVYQPRTPHIIANDASCWATVGADTTAPEYFATLEWIEMPWVNIS